MGGKSRFSRNPVALADSVRASHRRPRPVSNRPASFPPASRQDPASFPRGSGQGTHRARSPLARLGAIAGVAGAVSPDFRRQNASNRPRIVLEPSPRGIRPVILLCAQLDTLSSWRNFPTRPLGSPSVNSKSACPRQLTLVEKGATVTATYGRTKTPVAVFGPPPPSAPLPPRVPGRFAGQFTVPDAAFFAPLPAVELSAWETSGLVPPPAAPTSPA